MADEENVNASRFSVYVPAPEARLNMGKPETSNNSFGYPGISLETDKHFLLDVWKVGVVQVGQACLQTRGSWEQFSSGSMTLATKGDGRLAAKGKVLLAAGAGQGEARAIPYELVAPKWTDFNNLSLHYTVDSIHNNLKALFYGKNWKKIQSEKKSGQEKWFEIGYTKAGAGALLFDLAGQLEELGYDGSRHGDLVASLLSPLEWTAEHHAAASTHLPPWKKTSEYGQIKNFDPYAPSSLDNWLAVGLAWVVQAGMFLRRTADVLEAILPAIGDNELFYRLQRIVVAAEAVSGSIRACDPKRWARYNKDAWDQAKKRLDKFDKPFTDIGDTFAKLESRQGPFDISAVSDLTLKVRDADDGAFHDAVFTATAASLTVTLNDQLLAIEVARTADDADFVLDGHPVTWNTITGSWDGVPGGFNVSGDRFDQGGGGFSAAAGKHTSISDKSFESGSLQIDIDGTEHTKSVASLADLTAAGRATKLAALLDGVGGCKATTSGAAVTVVSGKRGGSSAVGVLGEARLAVVGITGAASGNGDTDISADELKNKLAALGLDYEVTTSGEGVKVKHKTPGAESYLEVKGELATIFFGADPKKARGKGFHKSINDTYLMLQRLDAWFSLGPLADLARPVNEAVNDAVKVWGGVEKALTELGAFLRPRASKPAIGLLGGTGGVTLGTTGPLYGAGHSVTLVAGGDKGQGPDTDKFIPLLEHVIWGVSKLNGLANDVVSRLWGETKTDDEKKVAAVGHLRLVSDGSTNLLSRGPTRVLSADEIVLLGKSFDAIATNNAAVTSRKGAASLVGKSVALGQQQSEGEQEATTAVTGWATEQIALYSKNAGLWVEDGAAGSRVALGKHEQGKVGLLTDKVHVLIDLKANKAFIGKGTRGLSIDGDGNVEAAGKSVKLSAGSSNVSVESSGVKISSSKIDLGGGALTVNGVGMPAPPEIKVAIDTTAALIAALKAKHATLIVAAKALGSSIEATDKSIEKANEAIDNVPMFNPIAAAKIIMQANKALRTAQKLREGLLSRLINLRVQYDAVVAEARTLGVDAIVGKLEEERTLFRWWSRA